MIKVNKKLFWDTGWRRLDKEGNADFIISRVLLRGDLGDFSVIKKEYSWPRIKKVAADLSYPDKKSKNFWDYIFGFKNIKKSLCTPKSSAGKQSPFLSRLAKKK